MAAIVATAQNKCTGSVVVVVIVAVIVSPTIVVAVKN